MICHCEERGRLRGAAEANPEIPRFARDKLRNPMKYEIAAPYGLAMTMGMLKYQVRLY